MFHWRSEDGQARRAFTSRVGGVSEGAYAGLNLGGRVGDDPAAVAENRRLLAEAVGVTPERLVLMRQCHSADVTVVDGPWPGGSEGLADTIPWTDAMVTTASDLALVVLVADCVPVLLRSADGAVIGAVHAGRQGMMKGIAEQAISAMKSLGAGRILADVGPSVCGRCYEVPLDMREEAASVRPESRTVSWTGTPAIDVAAGVVAQLHDRGVEVHWVPGCSREDPHLFSHRRDVVTGRSGGVIVRGGSWATP